MEDGSKIVQNNSISLAETSTPPIEEPAVSSGLHDALRAIRHNLLNNGEPFSTAKDSGIIFLADHLAQNPDALSVLYGELKVTPKPTNKPTPIKQG